MSGLAEAPPEPAEAARGPSAARAQVGLWRTVGALLRKELPGRAANARVGARRCRCSRSTTFVVFHFALNRGSVEGDLGAGILWVTLLFASILGVNRLFVADAEGGRLRRLPAGAGRPQRHVHRQGL